MIILYIITAVLVLLSFAVDFRKTLKAFRISLKRFLKISPAFGGMLILVSVAMYIFPEEFIADSLGSGSIWISTAAGSLIGSITLMPGFIAFPLCGVLRDYGVQYMVLSGFTTTLMMVGILSFPVEKACLGVKVAVVRNIISLVIALIVAVSTGIIYGEIAL